jgi:hypothetical protein
MVHPHSPFLLRGRAKGRFKVGRVSWDIRFCLSHKGVAWHHSRRHSGYGICGGSGSGSSAAVKAAAAAYGSLNDNGKAPHNLGLKTQRLRNPNHFMVLKNRIVGKSSTDERLKWKKKK